MKPSRSLEIASRARVKMQEALDSINVKLAELLGQDHASMFYQESDGWVILFDEDSNAPVAFADIDALLNMDREAALEYLKARSI